MNWTTAWLTMKQRHKVKRRGWKDAYWHISGTELLIRKEDGEELNFRKVKDIGMVLNATCCDDWEQVMKSPNREDTDLRFDIQVVVSKAIRAGIDQAVAEFTAEQQKKEVSK